MIPHFEPGLKSNSDKRRDNSREGEDEGLSLVSKIVGDGSDDDELESDDLLNLDEDLRIVLDLSVSREAMSIHPHQ